MATGLTDTELAQSQTYSGLFRRFPAKSGLAHANLKHDLDMVYTILENLCGDGTNIIVHKTDPYMWEIEFVGDGIAGYTEETLNIVTDAGIVQRTVLVKSADSADISTWGSGDVRKLLQVKAVSEGEGTAYKLRIDLGYLAEGD